MRTRKKFPTRKAAKVARRLPVEPDTLRLTSESQANAPLQSGGSRLERQFVFLWKQCGGGALIREFMFHPVRKWRADFCHPASRTLIEIEGGIWMNGRHNRGQGFADDCEKYLEATLLGYRLIRLVDVMLTRETISRIVALTVF